MDAITPEDVTARPWGGYRTTAFVPGGGCTKILIVHPGMRLSLQRHARREEHWVVLKGEVTVQVSGDQMAGKSGSYFYVPRGAWHRLGNAGAEEALVAETQVGAYSSPEEAEEDIERSSDDFGRA